jgi:ABC-type glutathione transport system ATPase component
LFSVGLHSCRELVVREHFESAVSTDVDHPDVVQAPERQVDVTAAAGAAAGAAAADPVLRCSGLRRRFGDRIAVDDVGFAIAAGETYGLLGPNGAGKTTTISIVAGILAADAGNVVIAGKAITTRAGEAEAAVGRGRCSRPVTPLGVVGLGPRRVAETPGGGRRNW